MKKFIYSMMALVAVYLTVQFWPKTVPPEAFTASQPAKVRPAVPQSSVAGAVFTPLAASQPASTRPILPRKNAREPKTKRKYQLVVQKPRQHAPITLDETPDHLKPVVLQTMSWTHEYLSKLTAADVEILKRWYQQQGTNLLAKSSLTWVLGYAGDEEVVDMFKFALFVEYAGKKLTSGYPQGSDEV